MITTNIKKIIKEDTIIYCNSIINKFRYSKLIKENKVNVAISNLTLKQLIDQNQNNIIGIENKTNGGF